MNSKKNKKNESPAPWGKRILGLLLLVPSLVATVVLSRQLSYFNLTMPRQLAFVTGAGVYLIMHLLLWKPIFIHVMGHELTHAFWAVILGGKIKSLLVSEEGGQVTISKTNFFIALAPYFFPLYTFIFLIIYLIAAKQFHTTVSFLIGFSLAFHIALTIHSLRDEQCDIRQVGVLFSFPFIYIMNILVLVIIFSVIMPELVSFGRFFIECWKLLVEWLTILSQTLLYLKQKVF